MSVRATARSTTLDSAATDSYGPVVGAGFGPRIDHEPKPIKPDADSDSHAARDTSSHGGASARASEAESLAKLRVARTSPASAAILSAVKGSMSDVRISTAAVGAFLHEHGKEMVAYTVLGKRLDAARRDEDTDAKVFARFEPSKKGVRPFYRTAVEDKRDALEKRLAPIAARQQEAHAALGATLEKQESAIASLPPGERIATLAAISRAVTGTPVAATVGRWIADGCAGKGAFATLRAELAHLDAHDSPDLLKHLEHIAHNVLPSVACTIEGFELVKALHHAPGFKALPVVGMIIAGAQRGLSLKKMLDTGSAEAAFEFPKTMMEIAKTLTHATDVYAKSFGAAAGLLGAAAGIARIAEDGIDQSDTRILGNALLTFGSFLTAAPVIAPIGIVVSLIGWALTWAGEKHGVDAYEGLAMRAGLLSR